MSIKLGGAVLGAILILLTAQGCVFGGDDGGGAGGPQSRPGAVPTATLPATLQDPILLGQVQTTSGGTNANGGSAATTYVIKSGDTLGGVATSLGVPGDQQAAWIAEVLRLNNITDARTLAVGVEIGELDGENAAAATGERVAVAGAEAATGQDRRGAGHHHRRSGGEPEGGNLHRFTHVSVSSTSSYDPASTPGALFTPGIVIV